MSIFHREPHSYYVNGFLHTLHSNALFLANIAGTNGGRIDMNSYYRVIYQIVSCKHSSIKHLHVYKYYTSLWCSFRTRYILLDNAYGNNKCRYKQHKSCLCTLLQDINHDAVSGWLRVFIKQNNIVTLPLTKCAVLRRVRIFLTNCSN